MTIRTFAWTELPDVFGLLQKELRYPMAERKLKVGLLQMEQEKYYQALVTLDGEWGWFYWFAVEFGF